MAIGRCVRPCVRSRILAAHAAVHQLSKYRWLRAPATNIDPGTLPPDPLHALSPRASSRGSVRVGSLVTRSLGAWDFVPFPFSLYTSASSRGSVRVGSLVTRSLGAWDFVPFPFYCFGHQCWLLAERVGGCRRDRCGLAPPPQLNSISVDKRE